MMLLRDCRLSKTDRKIIKGMSRLITRLVTEDFNYSDRHRRTKLMGMQSMIGHAIFMMRLESRDRRYE